MLHYLKIYKVFVAQNFRILILSRTNIILGIVTFLVMQIVNLLTIDIIFKNVSSIQGYSRDMILFIYGIFLIPRGFDHMISDYLWMFAGRGVRTGIYDKYLTKPIPTLFQVIIEKFDFNALAELILGIALIVKYGRDYFGNATNVAIFVAFIINGIMIYTALKIICAAVAFYTKSSFSLLNSVYQISNFAKYPMSIYPKGVMYILYFILPFGITTYLPFLAITGDFKANFWTIFALFSGVIFLFMANKFWNLAEKNYESTGS